MSARRDVGTALREKNKRKNEVQETVHKFKKKLEKDNATRNDDK